MTLQQRILGCILGTAVGDAIGLPREGLSRGRARRFFGDRPLHHALLAGRGMCSDDTEHTVMVAQSLIVANLGAGRFGRELSRRLRWWLLRLPAGVGLGTLRACLKLWLGFGFQHSGVPSAGNGPAMRSAILGLVAPTIEVMNDLVKVSARVTHTDPRAVQGAAVIATTARFIAEETDNSRDERLLKEHLQVQITDGQLAENVEAVFQAVESGLTAEAFADRLGLSRGVSGFVNHTVPVALYCWLAHRGDYRRAVESAVCLGGDADTVGAITGALAGAEVGPEGIPQEWLDGLMEWPCTTSWMAGLAEALSATVDGKEATTPPSANAVFLVLRNLVFIGIVFGHVFRRLLPPY